jgi:hypothetical protein
MIIEREQVEGQLTRGLYDLSIAGSHLFSALYGQNQLSLSK